MSDITYKGLLTIAATTVALATTGCTKQLPDEDAPDFKEGSGQVSSVEEYPTAAWGFAKGDIIPNLKYIGYANFSDKNLVGMQSVKLADFYNPTGDAMFPEGSPYGAGPKPKALNLFISSTWCPPCRIEAEDVLPIEYAKYKPQGGHFLGVLIDGPTVGDAATLLDLTEWAGQYETPYTMVLDPESKSMQFYEPAFPGNLIIRTSDMKIIEVVAGVPDSGFWNIFEQVLDGTYSG